MKKTTRKSKNDGENKKIERTEGEKLKKYVSICGDKEDGEGGMRENKGETIMKNENSRESKKRDKERTE